MHSRPRTSLRRIGVVLATAATAAATALAFQTPASAASDGLVINELYARGGSANQPYTNKFVEIYNPTNAPIDLSGYSIQYRSATGTADASGVAALTGSVAAKGYFVLALGSNGTVGAALPNVNQEAEINPSGTTGTVFLAKATTAINPTTQSGLVVDKIGYGTSNSPETSPAAYTGTNTTPGSLGRTGGVDTDNNSVDFTFADTPTPGTANGGVNEPDPEPEPTQKVAIAAIQGTGAESPLVNKTVMTEGVVTANYPTGGFNGFYLQTPGTGGGLDATPGASDGVFVYGSTDVQVGACYTVTATVVEFNGLTELTKPTITPKSGCEPVKAVDLATLPVRDVEKEQYEGMLVHPAGNYTITNNYQLNQFGQIGLAVGDQPLYVATDVVAPGPEAAAYEAANQAKYITLDDGSSWDYMKNATAKQSPLPYLSQATPMRAGASVTFTQPVILDYRFQWNYQPVGQVVGADDADIPVTVENTREATAPDPGGDIQLATFNVLNYFTDLGENEAGCKAYTDMNGTPVTADFCQVRGAYTPAALADQQAKIVAAINGSSAEVVALMEVENSAGITYLPGQSRDKALATLVDALNSAGGNWAYAPSPAVQSPNEDVIRTAFIYNPAKVALDGPSQILLDEAFANARYPLAQKFTVTGSKTSFVAVANHFKSKGSGADDGTGQGLSNPSREAQAKALTAWVGSEFADEATFLMGDFNAYSKETPVQLIEDAGFTNVEGAVGPVARAAGTQETTYQFSGRLGSLDHVFGNAKAMAMVTGAGVWDINADESVAMQYSRRHYNITDYYTTDPYAASDHDPAIVGITVDYDQPVDPDPSDPTNPGTPDDGTGTPLGPGNATPGTSAPQPKASGTTPPLAHTGTDAAAHGALALLLLASGAALVAAGRRRTA